MTSSLVLDLLLIGFVVCLAYWVIRVLGFVLLILLFAIGSRRR